MECYVDELTGRRILCEDFYFTEKSLGLASAPDFIRFRYFAYTVLHDLKSGCSVAIYGRKSGEYGAGS